MGTHEAGNGLPVTLPDEGYSLVVLLVEDGRIVEYMMTANDNSARMYLAACDAMELAKLKVASRWPKET